MSNKDGKCCKDCCDTRQKGKWKGEAKKKWRKDKIIIRIDGAVTSNIELENLIESFW